MQWKFQRENHNRQDKFRKPDYREDFLAESQVKSSPSHLASFRKLLDLGKHRMVGSKEIRAHKEQVMLRYYDGVFCLGALDFRFRWSLKEYIRRNRIDGFFNRTYTQHKKIAIHDFKEIERSIDEATARWGISKKGLQQPEFTFLPLLRCNTVVPFRIEGDDLDLPTLGSADAKVNEDKKRTIS